LAEIGRQPWVVYGLMPTEKAVSSSLSVGGVVFSLVSLVAIYGALAVITVFLMKREIATGVNRNITKKVPVAEV
jgi:cytochrome d ubiquinol oxidase subunit I